MPRKVIITSGKVFNYFAHIWRGFAEGFPLVVLFMVLCFKRSIQKRCVTKIYKEFETHYYLKIIVTIISTNLVTNSFLFIFCPFIKNQKKKQE